MKNEPLKYLSDSALSQLRNSIPENIDRYIGNGFEEYASREGWDIPLKINFDKKNLATLDTTRQRAIIEIDHVNSIIVGQALEDLTPELANEERIWVRLSHLEAFEYSKVRWLHGKKDEDLVSAIETHFFARSPTKIRDDHALSRLWWNYHIARTCMPGNVDKALELILKTADIRTNFVERIGMSSRRDISGAVLRAMDTQEWITGTQQNFREFMKVLNRQGGGIVFEALSESETDAFVRNCADQAMGRLKTA
ncbi:MAG: DUF6339 family protein [Bacteroidetes bacterium]|nr:DUF6339 family protein [Bacteroidota bacterium]